MTTIAAIIVNYCTPQLAMQALGSLAAERDRLDRFLIVYVIDNASPDGSGPWLAAELSAPLWREWVRFLPQSRNLGFAGGNNAALRPILENEEIEHILLLNPDTIVSPGAIQRLAEFFRQHPEAGIVGSGLYDSRGQRQVSAFRFPSAIGEFVRAAETGFVTKLLHRWDIVIEPTDIAHRADWVAGAAVLIRREVFETSGLLDEGYFLYFKEVDFMRAARLNGWQTWIDPSSHVVHLEGQSSGIQKGNTGDRRLPAYWYESWVRYFTKSFGRAGAIGAAFMWVSGRLIRELKNRILMREHDRAQTLRDFATHCLKPLLSKQGKT